MSVIELATKISRVAIYDDSAEHRDALAETLVDAKYDPVPIDVPFETAERCSQELEQYDAAIVDQRLSPGNFGAYMGSEVISKLYDKHRPALLVSAWSQVDREDIQQYRRNLACILAKGEYEPEDIRAGFEQCIFEFEGTFSPQRRATPTIIYIAADYDRDCSRKRVNAFVPSWDPNQGISFPIDIIPIDLIDHLREGTYLSADVNTGADSQDELYFENIELAPEVRGNAANFLRR